MLLRMLRMLSALAFTFLTATAQGQQIESSLSDRQIIANILKECRDLYMRSVGPCACAEDRRREGTRCNKVVRDLPETFKPFCTRKDVTLQEISMYRMQNLGFIDQRCSK
jgi:hypothetical protein